MRTYSLDALTRLEAHFNDEALTVEANPAGATEGEVGRRESATLALRIIGEMRADMGGHHLAVVVMNSEGLLPSHLHVFLDAFSS